MYQHVNQPLDGTKITINSDLSINVPNNVIIPYIEGDGIGIDITPVMIKVVNAAIAKAYKGQRKINWMEIYAGQKAIKFYGSNIYLPKETLEIIKNFVIAIKGPLTTPIGKGIRSLNVELRQQLDLYLCLRPIRYFTGIVSPLREPEKTDMVIFRENSEDIYTGIEWNEDSLEAKKIINFLVQDMRVKNIRFPNTSSVGIKLVSREGTERLMRKAIQYAIDYNRTSVTIVHKGNIMKFTEGSFCKWAYELAEREFGSKLIYSNELSNSGLLATFQNPKTNREIIIKDSIADAFFQKILLRPDEYSVIATLNLNGDYISDALAAQVGGIGISPGANLSDVIAVFEATHGTAQKYAGKNCANPASLILSSEMMLRYIGWFEAADLIISAIQKSIFLKSVTYDLARFMKNAKSISCSEFGNTVISHM